jgi:uncharacterized protein YeaO (DUF488 family)
MLYNLLYIWNGCKNTLPWQGGEVMGGKAKPGGPGNSLTSKSARNIQIKRVYDEPAPGDGYRVLVDRLWPRGLTKQAAAIDLWLKDLAPSNELRQWYGHEPEKWPEFKKRYFKELKDKPELLKTLQAQVSKGRTTLLFSSKETRLNNAAALVVFLTDLQ